KARAAAARKTGNGQRERHNISAAKARSKRTPTAPLWRGPSSGSTSRATTAALIASQRRGRRLRSTSGTLRVSAPHHHRCNREREQRVATEQPESAPGRQRVRLVRTG